MSIPYRRIMALPGETGIAFPSEYLTKVPEKTHRQEARLAKAGELLSITPKFVVHEDDRLYFDYGALRLGRKPELEEAGGAKLVCVGFGWLPGWRFTVNEAGLPDIVPVPAHAGKPSSGAEAGRGEGQRRPAGVLGLLFKLVLPDSRPTPRRSPFSKKAPVDVNDLPCASPRDWSAVVPFHSKLKVMKQVNIYVHVFDGAVGNKYQKDGTVVPFRTPDWPVKALVHVDPERPPVRVPRDKPKPTTTRCLQGEWVSDELQRWTREAKLPPEYVEKTLKKWIDAELEVRAGGGGLLKFFGFKV